MLDLFIPGFSVFSDVVQRYLHIDINLYLPMLLVGSGLIFAWKYFSEYILDQVHKHLMSSVDIRTDDELYNYIMAWVAVQRFSKDSRRFIANTNLNSRSWWVYRRSDEDEEDEEGTGTKKKPLNYTPTYGKHYFWYRGRLMAFTRDRGQEQAFLNSSEKEEIRVSCFGRNPWIIKELLNEAREMYMKRDESVTVIYRGSTKDGTSECSWQRCMARTSRPFSTVILNDKVKKELIDDVTDYLDPATRRWYSNRGIPYRRGYLLHGPPGTGKSSLSLALAGFFQMPIYIVSLNSFTANEENLSSLFAELPRRCVVLLEDIDTAGLTHTREGEEAAVGNVPLQTPGNTGGGRKKKSGSEKDNSSNSPSANATVGRLSLSALLNILDGVASQEGRVLIMTTNHIEKLDRALIRPGRVDMIVKFDRADRAMTAAIFKAIYARLEGDEAIPVTHTMPAPASNKTGGFPFITPTSRAIAEQAEKDQQAEEGKRAEREKQEKEADAARVQQLAELFADRIPAHEFSPAEIQGYLLKNKRNPDAAVTGAEDWVVEARKEKKEKELREAEEKRKEEEEKVQAEKDGDHKKEDSDTCESTDSEAGEQKKKTKKKGRKNGKSRKDKGKSKRNKSNGGDSGSDDSPETTSSESESEEEKKDKRKAKRKATKKSKDSTEVDRAPLDKKSESREEEGSPGEATKVTAEKGTEGAKHGIDSGYGTPTATGFPDEVGAN
jgi:chaperone BCS1